VVCHCSVVFDLERYCGYGFQMQLWVNGEQVAPEWIEEEFAQIKSWHEQRSQVSCCERDDEFRSQAKSNVVGRLLLNQTADREMPDPSPAEIGKALEQLHADYGGEDAFKAAMGIQEGQADFVQRQITVNLKVDQLIHNVCGDIDSPSEETLKQYFERHPEAYTTEKKVRALHIFKSLRQTEDKEQLFKECCAVRERLVAGEDFETIAREFSDKPAEEIDLGFFKRGELMDEFEFVAFSMGIGEVSPVFSSFHGFHLAKVIEIQPSTLQPFEEVKDAVKDAWIQQTRSEKIEDYMGKLRAKADIKEIDDEKEGGAGESSSVD
jgi:hypothetical protein